MRCAAPSPAVTWTSYTPTGCGPPSWPSLARPAVPLVVTLHNAVIAKGLRGQASALVERMVARTATLILGASGDLVERATALGARQVRLGAVAAPAMAAPRRSRAAIRAEFRLAPDTPLIVSVGRLHPQKRYDVLIDAAARWRDRKPAPIVVVAGSGPSYMALAQRASETRARFYSARAPHRRARPALCG